MPAPKPSKPREAVPGATVAEIRSHVKSAITVRAGDILPAALRHDPLAPRPALTDADVAETGLYDLANRGYLDPLDDLEETLSLGPDGHPMRAEKARVMPARLRTDVLARPAAATWEGHEMLNVRLDLDDPPIVPPAYAQGSRPPAEPYRSYYKNDKPPLAARARHRLPANPGPPCGAASPHVEPRSSFDGGWGTGGRQSENERDAGFIGEYAGAALAAQRGFEQIMDEHSLHEFIVRRGATLDATPEFESYRRAYATRWDLVSPLISQLERICARFAVPLAVVDGKALANCAEEMALRGEVLSRGARVDELLRCLVNVEVVAPLIGFGGDEAAAVTVQRHARGMAARRRVARLRLTQEDAVVPIQRRWRLVMLRRRVAREVVARRAADRAAFRRLQASLRASWPAVVSGPRVIVHIPSITIGADRRLSLANLAVRQNAQLSRLCDLADPDVEIIYVSPFPLSDETEGYYAKLLELGGIEDPPMRYRVVYPENAQRFPPHMSLASTLLYSPSALKRIQAFVLGRPAYIVPGSVGDDDRKLAVALDIPLLGPSPEAADALGRKSGARALFRAAEVNVAPGAPVLPESVAVGGWGENEDVLLSGLGTMAGFARGKDGWTPEMDEETIETSSDEIVTGGNVYAPGGGRGGVSTLRRECAPYADTDPCFDVVDVLARLAVTHPSVRRWIVKVDDESGGRGHAHVDVTSVGELQPVLRRAADCLRDAELDDGGQWMHTGGFGSAAAPADGVTSPGGSSVRTSATAAVAGDPRADEQLKTLCGAAAAILRRALPARAVLAAPSAYRVWAHGLDAGWEGFYAEVCARGGVVEACPEAVTGSPSACLFVSPTGEVHVLATHEQIFCPAYRFVGASFPQSSAPPPALAAAARAVGEAAYRAGVCGFVGVDFVVLPPVASDDVPRLWAVDLNVRPTCTQASFDLFNFVAGGVFDPETGTYSVPRELDDGVSGELEGAGAEGGEEDPRHYVVADFLAHPNLSSTHHDAFFNACRLEDVCFDMEDRAGTVFSLADSFASNVLGVVCVGRSLGSSFARLAEALDFMARQLGPGVDASRPPGVEKAGEEGEAAEIGTPFRLVHSTVKFLANRLGPD